VFRFSLARGRIAAIEITMDPARIGELSLQVRDA
jgi:hypothetical protein